MPAPTIDRFRYPFQIVPGDHHVIVLAWDDGSDKSGNTYEAVMYDAVAGGGVLSYVPDMTAAAQGTVVFKTLVPSNLTIGLLYEIRVRQLTRNAVSEIVTIIAGHVTIPSTTIAGAA